MRKKNLVKILSVIFTLTALCTCVALAVSAAGTSVNVNDETAYRGETVTFNATLSESVVVGSGSLAVSYDSSVLELTGGSCNVSGAMLANFDVAKGKGAFAFSGTNTVSGNLFTVTFRVKDASAFGTTDVSLTVTLKDGANKVISLTNKDGSITVKCNHSFTKEDTTYLKSEATCTSPAIYYKSCAICGEKGTETFKYGSTEPHSYTRQATTDTYKKSDASCTSKAVYYYCCATCDARGTTTYEYGSTLAHSYTRQVIEDAYKVSDADCDSKAVYKYCCATCDAKGTTTFEYGNVLGHTGGTATCTKKAECTRCHQPYGNLLEHVYTAEDATDAYLKSAATCTSKAIYYKHCATCDKAGTATFEYGSTEPHSYTKQVTTDAYLKSVATCTSKAVYYHCCETCNAKGTTTFEHGTTLPHNYTRKVVTDIYKKSAATCTDAAVYYYCCAMCDAKGTTTYTNGSELGHTGGTATCTAKAECTRCHQPYGILLEHVYTAEDATDAYLKSAATCTSKAVYYKHCATCDKAGTATFEYGTLKAHSYIDKVEDAYLKASATCTSKAVYYKSCSACGVKGTEIFEVGDTPSHNYQTTWSSDATSHWHECSKCGDKKDNASHAAGDAATEITAQTCTVCGYVITPALGHTHNYDNIKKDEANHWKECACGEKADTAVHTWDNGVVTKEATVDEEGVKTYTCAYCSITKTESIPKIVVNIENADFGVTIEIPSNSQATLPAGTVIDFVDKSNEQVSDQILGEFAETAETVVTALGVYDLNLLLDGVTIRPNGAVVVTLPAPKLNTEYDRIIVVYIAPDGSYEECKTTVNADGSISFETDHFSKYAVIGINEEESDDGLGTGAIIAIIIGALLVVGAGGFAIYWFVIKKKAKPTEEIAADTADASADAADEEQK